MTLLSLIQSACDRLNVPRPSVVISATDPTVRELLALANQEGQELVGVADWNILRKEKTFSTTATEEQTNCVPSDLDRYIDETFWNRSARRPLFGPLTSAEWQNLKAMTTSPVVDTFTFRGGAMLVNPVPPASQTWAFEYISTNWCQSSGGTAQSAWAADTDTGILSERLMAMGVIWRYKKARGMGFEVEFAEWQDQVRSTLAQETPGRTIDLSDGFAGWKKPGITVPSGSWNL